MMASMTRDHHQLRTRDHLHRLNRLPAAEAVSALLACCASRRWAATVAAGRPYPTPEALYDAAERAWWSLDEADWHEAFAAHPRIGERPAADPTARSEQAGVRDASAETLAALASGNRIYEERFDRVFLICASGRPADEMLAALQERLGNDPETELRTAAGEQAKIARLRLERLLT
jgi:OHCU decarboxylase